MQIYIAYNLENTHKKILVAVVCYCLIILIINHRSFANQGLILNTFRASFASIWYGFDEGSSKVPPLQSHKCTNNNQNSPPKSVLATLEKTLLKKQFWTKLRQKRANCYWMVGILEASFLHRAIKTVAPDIQNALIGIHAKHLQKVLQNLIEKDSKNKNEVIN